MVSKRIFSSKDRVLSVLLRLVESVFLSASITCFFSIVLDASASAKFPLTLSKSIPILRSPADDACSAIRFNKSSDITSG